MLAPQKPPHGVYYFSCTCFYHKTTARKSGREEREKLKQWGTWIVSFCYRIKTRDVFIDVLVPHSAGTGGQLFRDFGSGWCHQAMPRPCCFPLPTSKAEVAPVVAVGLNWGPPCDISSHPFFFFSFSFFFLPPPQVFSLEMSAWDSSINIHSTLAH